MSIWLSLATGVILYAVGVTLVHIAKWPSQKRGYIGTVLVLLAPIQFSGPMGEVIGERAAYIVCGLAAIAGCYLACRNLDKKREAWEKKQAEEQARYMKI